MEGTEEDEILRLYAEGKWEEILDDYGKNKFLPWVWPNRENLNFIANAVRSCNSNSLISIGCGSGLLEWLLKMATGLKVTGLETDNNWWQSKHSTGSFIPLVFTENSKNGELNFETENSVLLFCYFNNLEAFLGYMKNFQGNCFLVIGPGENRGTYTIPEPFHLPENLKKNWSLADHQEMSSSRDFIAVYVRK